MYEIEIMLYLHLPGNFAFFCLSSGAATFSRVTNELRRYNYFAECRVALSSTCCLVVTPRKKSFVRYNYQGVFEIEGVLYIFFYHFCVI